MAVNTEMLTPNYLQKWNWRLEIDGYTRAYFTTADRPKASFETVEINPGGTHRPVKAPGRLTFDDLTFEKGVLINNDANFLLWMEKQLQFVEGNSSNADWNNVFKDIDLVEFDQEDNPVNTWHLHGCMITNYDGNDLDGSASEIITESITLAYQYFTRE